MSPLQAGVHLPTDGASKKLAKKVSNITHLSVAPTPLTGVRCRRYVVRGSHVREQKQREEFQGKRYENDLLAEKHIRGRS